MHLKNWQILEGQPPKPVNIVNDHSLKSINAAKGCVLWLIAQGFTVLSAEIGKRNPRIEIEACRRCTALQGAIYVTEKTASGTRRGWVAIRFGCEVRWSEGGAA